MEHQEGASEAKDWIIFDSVGHGIVADQLFIADGIEPRGE